MNTMSYLQVYDSGSDEFLRQYEILGRVTSLMSKSASHAQLPLSYLARVWLPAIRHNNVKCYFNDDGEIVAMLAWAFLSEATIQRLCDSGRMDLHLSEWNEGDQLWIVDFLAPHGNLRYVLRNMRDQLFPGQKRISYCRYKRDHILLKSVTRSDQSAFFRSALPEVAQPDR
ncbi:hypothetical protein RugamoR64_55820 [Duganella rhizosphaerae]|uniref:toxin-activating lysine-acyltransferase n=1 Tax=Duganella rhizosphaerae TaxID=2885763 RepID=UPI0030E92D77